MRYSISHITTYDYDQPVTLCHSLLHQKPRNTFDQQCIHSSTHITPEPLSYRERQDSFGNEVAYFETDTVHSQLVVRTESLVERTAPARPATPTMAWDALRDLLRTTTVQADLEAAPMLLDSALAHRSDPMRDYAESSFPAGRDLLSCILDLQKRMFDDFEFVPKFTDVSTPVEAVLEHRRGVCQDFAHLAVACLRSMGLAARYVSGYIETEATPGQPKLVGVDASHAWCSVYLPGFGWLDFDPTNNQLVGDRHVTVGWGRDFADVTPLKGVVVGGGTHRVHVAVDVRPAHPSESNV